MEAGTMIQAFLALKEIHRCFDEAAHTLERNLGTPICIEKCGRCCEVNVPKSLAIEALHAVSVLAGKRKLKTAAAMAEDWLLTHHKEAPSMEGLPLLGASFISSKLNDEYYAIAGIRCPFELEDKSCFIHEARPLACRAFGVTYEPSMYCPRPIGAIESVSKRYYIDSPDLKEIVSHFKTAARNINPSWVISGFVPAMLYRAAHESDFKRLVRDNRIATAKLVGTPDLDTSIYWQGQVEALKKGVSPDLVAAGKY